jgi:hypothetical protein
MNAQDELIEHKERMLAYARSYQDMEEIGIHTKERKNVPLALDELGILSLALNELYNKVVRKLERSKQPRGIKQTQELGEIQEVLQYIAYVRNQWKEGRWEESI